MITNIFISAFEISLSIGAAILALILLTPFLNRRYAAKWKYWIWVLLALRLIIPFRGTGSIAGILTQLVNSTVPASGESNTDASPVGITPPRGVVIEIPAQMTAPIVLPAGDQYVIHITLLEIITAIWLAGSLVIVLLHIFSYLRYMGQLRKRGIPVNDGDILCKLQELKEELHIGRRLSIIRYSEAASPMIVGFIRPVLVLPQEAYWPEELAFILKHELVHLKRGDVYVKLLLMAANAVH
ncbi:MAG: M56 family metallopeptidase, partial [Lachnospiraceae bacterium]|nr:M56 family metallopeptidase [Lachnospiraceae bacterium]